MTVPHDFSAHRVESIKALEGREPKRAFLVLRNLIDSWILSVEVVMGEGLGGRIEPVQRLVAADPDRPGTIFEQCLNERSTETVGTLRIMSERPKRITVVTVHSVLSAKPKKAAVVLNYLSDPRLGQSRQAGEVFKPD